MTYQLEYHGLISVPERGKPVICWLRLFDDPGANPHHVAIVTDVPGNPGRSIANGHEAIQQVLVDRFGVKLASLAFYQVWPAGRMQDGALWSKIDRAGHAEDPDVSRAHVERLVGQDLPDLPEHAELYRQVLAFGGGVWQEEFQRVFEALPVQELPPPHNPSECAQRERFERILAEMPANDGPMQRDLEAGKAFLASLTPGDLARCRYHRADWRAVAEESVHILEACGDRAETGEYLDAASRSSLPKTEKGWLSSLFADAVFIGGGSYTNGQHRGCALRFSGADRAAIHTHDESLGMRCVDWVYKGGG